MAAIKTHALGRRFGDTVAVDDLDLVVPSGSVYGFLGPNGAGKSTTIKMVLGLIRLTSGSLRILGSTEPRKALSRIGAMVEAPSLYSHLTGRENLRITQRLRDTDRSEIDRVLDIVHLRDAANRPVRDYSMGMHQRLGLALALLGQPELLVLDEPTNGLDPAGIREIRDLLRNLPTDEGVTIFLSSHLLDEVERCATHIGVINHGKLLLQGPLEDLHDHYRERLVIGVHSPDKALALLREHQINAEKELESDRIRVDASLDPATINRLLMTAGIEVDHLMVERQTLEQLFIRWTEGSDA
jgi:ABC-2 type transport system ATP-binding protein